MESKQTRKNVLRTPAVKVAVAPQPKPWYESKTMWANILAVVGGVLVAIAGELAVGSTLTVAGVVNIILRKITNQPIEV